MDGKRGCRESLGLAGADDEAKSCLPQLQGTERELSLRRGLAQVGLLIGGSSGCKGGLCHVIRTQES